MTSPRKAFKEATLHEPLNFRVPLVLTSARIRVADNSVGLPPTPRLLSRVSHWDTCSLLAINQEYQRSTALEQRAGVVREGSMWSPTKQRMGNWQKYARGRGHVWFKVRHTTATRNIWLALAPTLPSLSSPSPSVRPFHSSVCQRLSPSRTQPQFRCRTFATKNHKSKISPEEEDMGAPGKHTVHTGDRLARLRELLKSPAVNVQAFVIPSEDQRRTPTFLRIAA